MPIDLRDWYRWRPDLRPRNWIVAACGIAVVAVLLVLGGQYGHVTDSQPGVASGPGSSEPATTGSGPGANSAGQTPPADTRQAPDGSAPAKQ